MATIKFTADIEDPNNGLLFGHDADFVLSVEATMKDGVPEVDVFEVWLDGVEMLTSNSELTRRIGCNISDIASSKEWVISAALDDAGFGWQGRGANDPDARWVAA